MVRKEGGTVDEFLRLNILSLVINLPLDLEEGFVSRN